MALLVLTYKEGTWRLTKGFKTLFKDADPLEVIRHGQELMEAGVPASQSLREGISRVTLGLPLNGFAFTARGASVLDLRYMLPILSAHGEGRKHEAEN